MINQVKQLVNGSNIVKTIKVPKGYWSNLQNQQNLLRNLANKEKIKSPEDWGKISAIFLKKHAKPLVLRYGPKPYEIVSKVLQEDKVRPFFWRVGKGYWNNIDNQRQWMEYVATKLGITSLEDWYGKDYNDVVNVAGSKFIQNIYNQSLFNALKKIYPNYPWNDFKYYKKKPNYFWHQKANVELFFNDLAKEFDIKHPLEFLNLSVQQVVDKGGGGLIKNVWNGSLLECLKYLYPNENWPNEVSLPERYWETFDNQINFVKEMEKALEIRRFEDWYNVSASQFREAGGLKGRSLLRYYKDNLVTLLTTVLPQHEWQIVRFERVSLKVKHFNKTESHRQLFEAIGNKLQINSIEEWYSIPSNVFYRFRGSKTVARKYGGYRAALIAAFPEYKWEMEKFEFKKHKSQTYLISLVRELLPSVEILVDYRSNLFFSSGYSMEFDMYLPTHKIAIEYQGEQHYDVDHFFNRRKKTIHNDFEKRLKCKEEGIILIEIPYWAHLSRKLLADVLLQNCPQISPSDLNYGQKTYRR